MASALRLQPSFPAMGGEDTRRYVSPPVDSAPALSDQAESIDGLEDDENIIVSAPPSLRLQIGRLIEGRLRIVRLLGRGGMSEVYEAYDEHARRTVAIKLLLTEQCAEAQLAIFAEARALVNFRHSHVVGFYGVGAIEAQPFVELESASGGSLAEIVQMHGVLPVVDGLDLLIKAGSGLAALHAAGTVHRDVKADNILLTEDGRPVIADMGLAIHREDLPSLPSGIVGTPAYMAPEAILGVTETFEQYAAADQYSFAILAYYTLTGTLPFDAPTPSGLFYAQMAVEPDPPSTRRADLPPEIDEILMRALSKRATDRYASVGELCEALAAVRAKLGPAREPSIPARESGMRAVPTPALKPTVVAA